MRRVVSNETFQAINPEAYELTSKRDRGEWSIVSNSAYAFDSGGALYCDCGLSSTIRRPPKP